MCESGRNQCKPTGQDCQLTTLGHWQTTTDFPILGLAWNRAEVNLRVFCLRSPHFASIYKSKKQFGLSFAYDAPIIWNDLPDDVRSAKSLSSFRKKLKTYLFEKAYPPQFFPLFSFRLSPWCRPLQCL